MYPNYIGRKWAKSVRKPFVEYVFGEDSRAEKRALIECLEKTIYLKDGKICTRTQNTDADWTKLNYGLQYK